MPTDYTPFGANGHVIESDVKLSGNLPAVGITVRFRSAAEINALIDSLTLLRDDFANARGHIHLQDGCRETDGYPAEIVLMNPTWFANGGEQVMRDSACNDVDEYIAKHRD